MPKNRIIFILGLVIALVPHTGFPRSWSSVLFTLFGLAIAGLSWTRRGPSAADSFSRHTHKEDEQVALADARAFVAEEMTRDERVEEADAVAGEISSSAEEVTEEKMPPTYEELPKRRVRQARRRIKKEKSGGKQNTFSTESAEAPAPPFGMVVEELDESGT